MSFGLCNASTTFQRGMVSIFSNLIENCIEIFIDDFSVFGTSFYTCLRNLNLVLKRCRDTRLVLNREKCQFMVRECIVLGHKVSHAGIDIGPGKVEVIANFPTPNCVRVVRSFLGHVKFYKRFVKDLSKMAKPLNDLLAKEAIFYFSDECLRVFNLLKQKLVNALVVIAPNWSLPFELTCDASG